MKKIVIIVLAVVLLGGGGFAGWKFFLHDDKEKKEETIKIEDLTSAELTALTVKMEGETEVETNLADGSKISVKFDVVLENEKAHAEFIERNSQMNTTALSKLMSLPTEQVWGAKGKEFLEDALKKEFNSWMKEGKVLEVWITHINIR